MKNNQSSSSSTHFLTCTKKSSRPLKIIVSLYPLSIQQAGQLFVSASSPENHPFIHPSHPRRVLQRLICYNYWGNHCLMTYFTFKCVHKQQLQPKHIYYTKLSRYCQKHTSMNHTLLFARKKSDLHWLQAFHK